MAIAPTIPFVLSGGIDTFSAGTVLVFTAAFTLTESGALGDPGEVMFAYQMETGSPVYFDYDGGSGQVTKIEVGLYTIEIDTTGLVPAGSTGLMTGEFAGTEGLQANDSITVRITAPSIPIVFA